MPSSTVKTRISHSLKTFNDAQNVMYGETRIPICGNTWLQRETDGERVISYALVFHNTKIIRYLPDGRISLNSGGYRTATTKHRMNQFSPVKVASVKGEWVVYPPTVKRTDRAFDWDNPVPFVDHDVLNPDYLSA